MPGRSVPLVKPSNKEKFLRRLGKKERLPRKLKKRLSYPCGLRAAQRRRGLKKFMLPTFRKVVFPLFEIEAQPAVILPGPPPDIEIIAGSRQIKKR